MLIFGVPEAVNSGKLLNKKEIVIKMLNQGSAFLECLPEKYGKDMGDIKMNSFQVVNDAGYIYGELENGKQIKIKNSDLIHIVPIFGFNGDFKSPANFPKEGLYIYNVNTELSGIINGPDGITVLYGVVEIISRIAGYGNGLNVVTIKIHSRTLECFMLIGMKNTGEDFYKWGTWKKIY